MEKHSEHKTDDGKTEEGLLQVKLEECEKEKNEFLELAQRMKADLANYKKEEANRMEELRKWANEDMILHLLPLLDSLNLALQHIPEEIKKDNWVHGIRAICGQYKSILKSVGVTEIPAKGEHFNPALHEAVGEIKSDEEDGKIAEELQKGYKLHGKVIRAAKVKISTKH